MLITHHAGPIKIIINKRGDRGDFLLNHIKARFAEDYIISLKHSFQILSGLKEHSRQLMAATTRQQFCRDTLNIFGHEDQNFQWSRAYSYYSSPSAQKEVIWTSEIARAGCVPEVFDCKELVSWCTEKYIPSQWIIQLQDHSPISLSPQVFRKMLKLPEPTLTFKGEDCRDFLKKHDNDLDLLPEFLENPMAIPEDITRLQVNSFKNPFREIAWLFTRVTGQENTANISHMILYILYFTVKEQAIFDWGKLISIEISSQLSQYKKDKKFFMASYLVFAIAHCCQFPKLFICKKVNCEFDPVTFWYQALWRHKASLHFYEVFNDFVSVFKGLSIEKFYGIIEYDEDAIDNWLVDYSVKNQDIEEALHGISLDLRDLEGELFNIKIQHEINVAPMKSYIEEWFKKAIDKLTNEGQEAVETVPVTVDENDKRTSTSK
jgi:hypothetical protein